jgi:NADPH-dependent curcumin reductase
MCADVTALQGCQKYLPIEIIFSELGLFPSIHRIDCYLKHCNFQLISIIMTIKNNQILLDNRPTGEAQASNFKLVQTDTPALQDGEVLVRHHYLSLDPYMRGRMNDAKSYAQPQPLGQVMQGGTVGEVVESRSPKFALGDRVVGFGGWQEYSVVNAGVPGMLKKVDTTHVPLSHYLGAVGMPGVTAWYGLNEICKPKAGETMVVSAASGAVGSAFGALAKARGCRAVGIAGGKDKCDYVVNELGFDACIDYKQHSSAGSLSKALREACPKGIDGYFENVGGMVLDAVMLRMNAFGRMAFCGMIAGYDGQPLPLANPTLILVNRLKIEGFIVSEHMEVWPQALAELGGLVATGKLRPRESVAQGLAAAPEAFLGLLKGKNFGKQLVKLV